MAKKMMSTRRMFTGKTPIRIVGSSKHADLIKKLNIPKGTKLTAHREVMALNLEDKKLPRKEVVEKLWKYVKIAGSNTKTSKSVTAKLLTRKLAQNTTTKKTAKRGTAKAARK